ncbi:MAG: peptidoglycan binding protein CsiV [Woeseiaceae bacterium]|nr:peptidoglycan binding protein CsiV [Woeseiaceae bacterium]
MRKILTALVLWLLCAVPSSRAQLASPDAPDATAETPRRYTVEIIVFEYAGSARTGNEIFVAEPIEPVPDDATEGVPEFTDMPQAVEAGKPTLAEIPLSRQIELSLLPPERYSLHDVYRKLQTLDAYKPIMHTAWTQTTVEKDLTPPVRLRMLGRAPLGLDGHLTLYLSRYLHLVVDLALDADPSAQSESDPFDTADAASQGAYIFSDKPELQPSRVRYRIFEDRIFKSGDLRYFDHPKFGVLAKVTRDEAGEPDPGQSGAVPAGSGGL